MKLTYTLLLVLSVGFLNAQVGIGTTNPLSDLHVAGELLVTDEFLLGDLRTVTPVEKDFKLITRSKDTSPVGELGVLNPELMSVAPVNTVDYHFTNLNRDNLSNVDLQYDSAKYVVALSNFRYVGDPIRKINASGSKSIGNFVVRVFEENGTWHLEIRNRTLNSRAQDTIEYYVTLIIYDKQYFRYLTPITTDLGGSNTGTASSVPVLN